MPPKWFLYVQGFAMVIMGVALLYLRPRPRPASFVKRFGNLGTLWAIICCAVGLVLLGTALGYCTLPLAPAPPTAPHARHPL